ncbi:MAG: DUF1573 domain-containing protein [Muribaculaceae bacterium]|nr:DUF1573 domain-containing protein [Muribaculaceae bacterium]
MNHHPIILTLLVSAATLFISSCNDKRAAHTNIIAEWVGREIVMPDDLVYQIQGDTIDLDLSRPDFKIVSYIDSTGCTSCRMKLTMWSELINEIKSLPDVDVEVIMIINTDTPKEITYLLQRDNYLNPVAIDRNNLFDRLNELPPRLEHHTFLLDAENKVVAIGNPVLNPKIKDLYLQYITEGDELPYTNDMCKEPVQPVGVINKGDIVQKLFYINNYDTVNYTLQAIIPSCDCVSASADRTNLDIENKIKVVIKFIGDSTPGYFNRHVNIFFNEKELPERLIVYGYNK